MGTKERRQREFAEREHRILDAAREQIREVGLLNLQMSRLAERCEYAVGTLYQHFQSKEDLVLALTTDNVREHVELFQRVAAWKAGTRERMFAIGVSDMIFVKRHPDHYRLWQYAYCEVVWKGASAERREEALETNRPLGEIVTSIIDDAVAAGDVDLQGMTPEEFATGFWALCGGFHSLVHAEGVLEAFEVREPYRLMCRHLQGLLNGRSWKPLADLQDAKATDKLIKRICNEVFDGLCA